MCIRDRPTSINVEAYGKMVEAASIRRKLLLAAGSIAKLAYNCLLYTSRCV